MKALKVFAEKNKKRVVRPDSIDNKTFWEWVKSEDLN